MTNNTEPVSTIEDVVDQAIAAGVSINLEWDSKEVFNQKFGAAREVAVAQLQRICASERLQLLQRIATIRSGEGGHPETISNHVFDEMRTLQTQLEGETQ